MNINFERTKLPPWGLHGGGSGGANYAIIRHASGAPETRVLKGTQIPLQAGDSVAFFTAGGGGYGDPGARSKAAVENDLREGFVRVAAAE